MEKIQEEYKCLKIVYIKVKFDQFETSVTHNSNLTYFQTPLNSIMVMYIMKLLDHFD